MVLPSPYHSKQAHWREVLLLALFLSLQAKGWQTPSLKILGALLAGVLGASRTARLKFGLK